MHALHKAGSVSIYHCTTDQIMTFCSRPFACTYLHFRECDAWYLCQASQVLCIFNLQNQLTQQVAHLSTSRRLHVHFNPMHNISIKNGHNQTLPVHLSGVNPTNIYRAIAKNADKK